MVVFIYVLLSVTIIFCTLQSDAGSSSELSDSASTPLNKSTTPSQTSPAVDVTKENTNDSLAGKSLSSKGSKSDKSKREKSLKGTPEKTAKSKSPTDKPQAVVEPFEKSVGGEGSSVNNQAAVSQPPPAAIQGPQRQCLANALSFNVQGHT